MNPNDHSIIEMRASKDSEGELHYIFAKPSRKKSGLCGWFIKILGVALGVAAFLLFVFFFVYVVIPLVLILILCMFVRNILQLRH
ncbi:MAG: hypothetical protein AUJ72_04125 [Candidatus Omnitrophica bacterium CG1_02_46_14]|nr:MAG: hypothetical protein AUJ72_04125 [Candidatus Omnitrophica bacterium CG1_02_46_14]